MRATLRRPARTRLVAPYDRHDGAPLGGARPRPAALGRSRVRDPPPCRAAALPAVAPAPRWPNGDGRNRAGFARSSWRATTPPARAGRHPARRAARPTALPVTTFATPTADEKRHHFLWRFYRELPGSAAWRVRPQLVRPGPRRADRGVCHRPSSGRRGYHEIVDFERTLVLEGVILIKFWMHISDEEQLRRASRSASRSAQALEADRRGLAQPGEDRDYDVAAEECSPVPTMSWRPGTSSRPSRSDWPGYR